MLLLTSKLNLFRTLRALKLPSSSPNFIKLNMSSNCVFCNIVARIQPADVIFEDDEIIIFKDIKPASKVHFLVVPKLHVKGPNTLTNEHKNLLQKMIDAGKNVMQEKGCNLEDTITGFHWPPFNSVNHLHLHVINPASEMGFISRMIFKPNTWWFVTDNYVMNKISEPKVTSHL